MAMKDITDKQVLLAYRDAKVMRENGNMIWPEELLVQRTGQPKKVCYRCMERAEARGLVNRGVSTRSGWITDEGEKVINS